VLWLHVLIAERQFVPTVACGAAGSLSASGVAITTGRIPVLGSQLRTSNKFFRARLASSPFVLRAIDYQFPS
jgi:hypothetical protein